MVPSGSGVNIDLARALKYHSRMPLFEPVLPDPGLVGKLERICGAGGVSVNEPDRIAYSRDMWPRSLIRQRLGTVDSPPDAIVWPQTADQVSEVVRLARKVSLPVVPFGAGSGVCGGTLPLLGGIVLDLKRMNRILEIQPEDRLLVVEAGAMGENLERELNRQGKAHHVNEIPHMAQDAHNEKMRQAKLDKARRRHTIGQVVREYV